MNHLFKLILTGTALSILVFLSVSFISFLTQINPIHYYATNETYRLDIGFPFKFYEQFFLSGSRIPNSGWHAENLLLDCFLTWITIAGLYVFINVKKSKK